LIFSSNSSTYSFGIGIRRLRWVQIAHAQWNSFNMYIFACISVRRSLTRTPRRPSGTNVPWTVTWRTPIPLSSQSRSTPGARRRVESRPHGPSLSIKMDTRPRWPSSGSNLTTTSGPRDSLKSPLRYAAVICHMYIYISALQCGIKQNNFLTQALLLYFQCIEGRDCKKTCNSEEFDCFVLDDNGFILITENHADTGKPAINMY
jgi:hypothetical protein